MFSVPVFFGFQKPQKKRFCFLRCNVLFRCVKLCVAITGRPHVNAIAAAAACCCCVCVVPPPASSCHPAVWCRTGAPRPTITNHQTCSVICSRTVPDHGDHSPAERLLSINKCSQQWNNKNISTRTPHPTTPTPSCVTLTPPNPAPAFATACTTLPSHKLLQMPQLV